MVFQDPYGSLNPRMRVRDIVGRPLTIYERVKGKPDAESGIVVGLRRPAA